MSQDRLTYREFEKSRLGTLLLMGFHAFSALFWCLLELLSQGKSDPSVAPFLTGGFWIFMGLSAFQFMMCLLRLLRGKTIR